MATLSREAFGLEDPVVEMTVSREIAAAPERVWEIITDIEGSPSVLSGIVRVDRLDDGEGFGVGTRWRETRVMFGKEATEEMQVTAVDVGRSYTTRAVSRGTVYTSVLRVEPRGGGSCLLEMSFGAAPSGTVSKLLSATVGRLFQTSTRKMLLRDLDDIAAGAESSSTA